MEELIKDIKLLITDCEHKSLKTFVSDLHDGMYDIPGVVINAKIIRYEEETAITLSVSVLNSWNSDTWICDRNDSKEDSFHSTHESNIVDFCGSVIKSRVKTKQ